jgi:hypothetical protein
MSANGKSGVTVQQTPGTDAIDGLVPIELDKPREVRFGLREIRQIERETGANLALLPQPFFFADATRWISILGATLQYKDGEQHLSGDELARLYYAHTREIVDKLSEAWNLFAPTRKVGPGSKSMNIAEATPDPLDSGLTSGATAEGGSASANPSSGI